MPLTYEEKLRSIELYEEGYGYKRITKMLGKDSEYMVRDFFRTKAAVSMGFNKGIRTVSNCQRCGNQYKIVEGSNIRYCSEGCKNSNKKKMIEEQKEFKRKLRLEKKAEKEAELIRSRTKVCGVCKEKKIFKSAKAKYCSDSCKLEARRIAYKLRLKEVTCSWCGSEFETANASQAVNFCSDECKELYNDEGFLVRQVEFNNKIMDMYKGKFLVVSRYTSSNKPVEIKCTRCNHVMKVEVAKKLTIRDTFKCIKCEGGSNMAGKSIGEENVKKILDSMDIKYKREVSMVVKEIKLRFDFCISINGRMGIIEYDGIQHFKPVTQFGGNVYFKKLSDNDAIKNRYAKKNDIPLLRIKYTQNDIMQELIDRFVIREF